MSENKEYRIYDKETREWFPVSEEDYEAYDRERTAYRKRMQTRGRCCCPRGRWWVCDMTCDSCEFCLHDGLLSLDDCTEDEEGEEYTLYDRVGDSQPRPEEELADRDLVERLFQHLRRLDPEADTIIRMWQENDRISDREIAKALGRPQRTFADQMKRYRKELKKLMKIER